MKKKTNFQAKQAYRNKKVFSESILRSTLRSTRIYDRIWPCSRNVEKTYVSVLVGKNCTLAHSSDSTTLNLCTWRQMY